MKQGPGGMSRRRRRLITGLAVALVLAVVGYVPPVRERIALRLCYAALDSDSDRWRHWAMEYLEALLKRGRRRWAMSEMIRLSLAPGTSEAKRLGLLAVLADVPYARLADLTDQERDLLTAEGLAPGRRSEEYRARLLARIGGPDEVAVLRGALLSEDPTTRLNAVRALSKSPGGFPELRDAYLACLTDEHGLRLHPKTREVLASLAVRLGDARAGPILRTLMATAPPPDRARLNAMLVVLGDQTAVSAWRWDLFQGTPAERRAAQKLLLPPYLGHIIPDLFGHLETTEEAASEGALLRSAVIVACFRAPETADGLAAWWRQYGPHLDHRAYVLEILMTTAPDTTEFAQALVWAYRYGLPETAERARYALAHAQGPRARFVAAEFLGLLGDPAGIDGLLDEVERRLGEPDGEKGDLPRVVYILRDLTGQNFFNNVPAWRRWWRENRLGWVEAKRRAPQVPRLGS